MAELRPEPTGKDAARPAPPASSAMSSSSQRSPPASSPSGPLFRPSRPVSESLLNEKASAPFPSCDLRLTGSRVTVGPRALILRCTLGARPLFRRRAVGATVPTSCVAGVGGPGLRRWAGLGGGGRYVTLPSALRLCYARCLVAVLTMNASLVPERRAQRGQRWSADGPDMIWWAFAHGSKSDYWGSGGLRDGTAGLPGMYIPCRTTAASTSAFESLIRRKITSSSKM